MRTFLVAATEHMFDYIILVSGRFVYGFYDIYFGFIVLNSDYADLWDWRDYPEGRCGARASRPLLALLTPNMVLYYRQLDGEGS